MVDPGFRGVDVQAAIGSVQLIHRGKFTSLDKQQRKWLKRRHAIEPLIGQTKSDNRMERCGLQGGLGDALHAVLCAAGFNIRWLLRAIARKGVAARFLALSQWALYAARIKATAQITGRDAVSVRRKLAWLHDQRTFAW